MNLQILAIVIQEGTKILSDVIKNRPIKRAEEPRSTLVLETKEITEGSTASDVTTGDEKIEKGVACLPCVNSHTHACVGLLSEANRMSPDGLTVDSMERVDKCLGEIAAAERIDLAPENIAKLPPEEQEIARYAAKEFRNIRHDLEGLTSKDVLERTVVKTVALQKHIGKEYFKYRLSKMKPAEKQVVLDTLERKIKEQQEE